MTIFVININTKYGKYSLPFIKKLCDYNNINLFILDKNIKQNIYDLHPSWLKLFCHSLIDDDFIVTWDCDLIPTHLYKLNDVFNHTKLNFCYDYGFTKTNIGFNHKFKYNAGFIGIPRQYKTFLEDIYYKHGKNATYPSYEQYYLNDQIYDDKIDINVIDIKYNYMFCKEPIETYHKYNNVHYTWQITDTSHREKLIEQHYDFYKKILNYENF